MPCTDATSPDTTTRPAQGSASPAATAGPAPGSSASATTAKASTPALLSTIETLSRVLRLTRSLYPGLRDARIEALTTHADLRRVRIRVDALAWRLIVGTRRTTTTTAGTPLQPVRLCTFSTTVEGWTVEIVTIIHEIPAIEVWELL